MKRYSTAVLIVIITALGLYSCSGGDGEDQGGDRERANRIGYLEDQKQLAQGRFPCDTLALKEYIINNYPAGSYLLEVDRTVTLNVSRAAVIYYNSQGNYVFAVIAKSKPGERLIEPKNVVGFESSFINLDSTKLGTAFLYLTLFRCSGDNFEFIWEHEIPMHGGFNNMTLKTWRAKGIPYVDVNFEDGLIVGHRDYNFFLTGGLTQKPHMLETYSGIATRRNFANVNDDEYPDYYETIFYDLGKRVYASDSVAFVWNTKQNLYVNTRNPRQTREY